jgi:hypothetical protein
LRYEKKGLFFQIIPNFLGFRLKKLEHVLQYLKKDVNNQEGSEDDSTNETNLHPKFDENLRLEKEIVKLFIDRISIII